MLKKTIEKAFNTQLNHELYSSYLYLSMAAYFNSLNLEGFEKWMKIQSLEEQAHSMKFYSFIAERGGSVKLEQINKPESKWKSPLDAFEATLKHEEFVTSCINKLVALARKENDFASEAFLQWFVSEQVEEEAHVGGILEKLKLAKGSPDALLFLDQKLSERVVPPAEPL